MISLFSQPVPQELDKQLHYVTLVTKPVANVTDCNSPQNWNWRTGTANKLHVKVPFPGGLI